MVKVCYYYYMISIIILSYNTKEVTKHCLDCIYRSSFHDFEVIVVDNASSDGTVQLIHEFYPQVTLIENKSNVGFAQGNNQAFEIAKGEWVLLLNSDAFVFEDTLELLSARLASSTTIDVAGVKLLYSDGRLQPSWGYFPTIRRVFQMMIFIDSLPYLKDFIDSIHVRSEKRFTQEREVDWVTGAFVIIKKIVISKVGGIDENYFMYGEEMEWMYRIHKSGFKIWYLPSIECVHLEGKSSSDRAVAVIGEMKGWIYWFTKHGTTMQVKLVSYAILIGCYLRILLKRSMSIQYKQAISQIRAEVFVHSN